MELKEVIYEVVLVFIRQLTDKVLYGVNSGWFWLGVQFQKFLWGGRCCGQVGVSLVYNTRITCFGGSVNPLVTLISLSP